MSSFTVTARHITLAPIENADRLELALIAGTEYMAVVPKGQHADGDLIVYIPEQAILTDALIDEMGLVAEDGKTMLAGGTVSADGSKKRDRVKALRLRGTLSQGLVYHHTAKLGTLIEGEDYAEALGVTKYEPPIPTEMSGKVVHVSELRSYTDIENIKNYPGVFTLGEEVVAVEKAHGCLGAGTNVLMPDWTRRTIRDLVGEGYRGDVLGVDEHGRVVPTPVLNTFDNGVTDGWMYIQAKRVRAGKGKPTISVTATENHRFYCPASTKADGGGYVRADELQPGDRITTLRYGVEVLPLAEQVLIGKMLGDGSLARDRSNLQTARVEFGHCEAQREYVNWTLACLGELGHPTIDEQQVSGYGSRMVRAKTVTSAHVSELFGDWVQNGVKEIPASAAARIGPIALAFWYMDDGDLAHTDNQEDRARFATDAFSAASINVLRDALAKFGIGSAVQEGEKGLRLRLNADDAERLFLLIAPYIPPCMQYKLPERYRGAAGWHPVVERASYKPLLVEQQVLVVRQEAFRRRRYDLETATHNFFANGILVHNSCSIFTLLADGSFAVASKGLASKQFALEPETDEQGRMLNVYHRVAESFGVAEVLAALSPRYPGANLTLFGETLGVQDLMYGLAKGTLDLKFFDLRVGERYLDYDEFADVCVEFGLPLLPLLYRGPFERAKLEEAAVGREQVTGKEAHVREGVVVRPIIERRDPELGRVILKVINPAYLTKRGDEGTEFE